MLKKLILFLIASALLISVPFVIFAAVYFCVPNQYGDTYLGELKDYFNKLTKTNEKKIVIIGGSNVAFGVNVDLMEEKTGYKVVPFGLYATLGIKLMLDLSLANINEGDVVIISPELNKQSLSNYFNPEITLQAVGEDRNILRYIDLKDREKMVYKAGEYISNNYSLYTGKKIISLSGVYQKSSFNENCNMIYPRPKNTMKIGFDPTTKLSFNKDDVSTEFINYLNKYANKIEKKKAKLYYSFAPMNKMAVSDLNPDNTSSYYDYLQSKLNFKIISSPNDYLLDHSLFFDSNFHLNDNGSLIRTKQLIEDIYRELGILKSVDIFLPSGQSEELAPDTDDDGGPQEDDVIHISTNTEQKDYYLYEPFGNGLAITGVKDEFKDKQIYHVPSQIGDKEVICLNENSFIGCSKIEEVHLYNPLSSVISGAFNNCSTLKKIYNHTKADQIIVNFDGSMLDGCNTKCKIYVYKDYFYDYTINYFWGSYSASLETFS